MLWIALVLLAAAAAWGTYRWRNYKRPARTARPRPLGIRGSRGVDRRCDRRSRGRAGRAPRRDRRVRADGGSARPSRPATGGRARRRSSICGGSCSASPRAATPSARLTGLFEQAKFSRHEIDGTMKHDAIGALREIRDDLGGARCMRRHLLDLHRAFGTIATVVVHLSRRRPARLAQRRPSLLRPRGRRPRDARGRRGRRRRAAATPSLAVRASARRAEDPRTRKPAQARADRAEP